MSKRNSQLDQYLLANSVPDPSTGCWIWQRGKDQDGYGFACAGNRKIRAHRVAYEVFVGPIPEGKQIDHLCRTPGCINPAHLEPVSSRLNTLRGNSPPAVNAKKETCKCGGTLVPRNGQKYRRICLACSRACSARWRALNKPKRSEP